MDKQIEKIKEYLEIINPKIVSENKELIYFVIEETIDRVQLYLNSETVPKKLERIIANIVNTGFKKTLNEMKKGLGVESAISSISDNGQSISFSNEITKYFSTASDEELFTGFATLLSRYRRIKVVNSRYNETKNS